MGLFYGGSETSWSTRTLKQVIVCHGQGAKRATIIDLHTGVGPTGFCEVMDLSSKPGEEAEWSLIGGFMCDTLDVLDLECAPTKLILEFGTIPFDQVLDAHRRDNCSNATARTLRRNLPRKSVSNLKTRFLSIRQSGARPCSLKAVMSLKDMSLTSKPTPYDASRSNLGPVIGQTLACLGLIHLADHVQQECS